MRLLIVFAKTPVAGQVKTRLGAVVGPDQAAKIYEHLLETCLTASATNDLWRQVIAITPESDEAYFARRGLEIMRQSGTDLGERMSNALARGFELGADQIMIVGSDIPNIDSTELSEAFSMLNRVPAVIGPCTDGGFYLFGVTAQHYLAATRVFTEDIKWSTTQVLASVQTLCRRFSLPLSFLPLKSDIDTYEDWQHYRSAQTGEE